ncbi:EF-hand calcium-binding domain-containing protein 5 [Lobulomyces angularis]|nr:EF-hand calcium-binding domain-containing protein 5 [Lobulomyces angularis]
MDGDVEESANLRDLAVQTLTYDFLDVTDAGLDFRAYLVETTLPSVIVAIDKLLQEVERRNLVNENIFSNDGTDDENKSNLRCQRPIFDPLNWLAQYLYRNNPRYANFSNSTASPYAKGMHEAGMQLKSRLFELETNKRAKKRAEELLRKQEEAHEKMIKAAQDYERQRTFEQILPAIFAKWSTKLWRQQPGFLLRDEVLTGAEYVAAHVSVALVPELHEKFNDLKDSLIGKIGNENKNFLQDSELSDSVEGINQKIPVVVPNSVFSVVWGLPVFIDNLLALMAGWTIEDLNEYLTILSNHIEEVGEDLKKEFQNMIISSTFLDAVSNTTKHNFKIHVLKSISEFKQTDPILRDKIKLDFNRYFVSDEESREVADKNYFVKFLEQMVGEYGFKLVAEFLEFLGNDQNIKDALLVNATKENTEENETAQVKDTTEVKEKDFALIFKKLFNSKTEILVKDLNLVLENAINSGTYSAEILEILMSLKITVPARNLATKTIDSDALTNHYKGICSLLEALVYREIIELLTVLFNTDEVASLNGADTFSASPPPASSSQMNVILETNLLESRSVLEKEAAKKIKLLVSYSNTSVAQACQSVLEIVTQTFNKIYASENRFEGTISLTENLISEVKSESNMEGEGISSTVMKKVLRYISCTEKKKHLYDTIVENANDVEYEVLSSGKSYKSESRDCAYIGSPIVENSGSVGVLSFNVEDLKPVDEDLRFLEVVASLLVELIHKINYIHKTMILALESKDWAESQNHVFANVYLVDDSSNQNKEDLVKYYSVSKSVTNREADNTTSQYNKLPKGNINLVEDIKTVELLNKGYTSRISVEVKNEEDGVIEEVLPILDETGTCAMILCFHSLTSSQVTDDEMEDSKKLSGVLEAGVNQVLHESFSDDWVSDLLDAEKIDEETRRDLLFSKLMLMAARNLLRKLDNKALSELKSYKKPPTVIYQVMKATLLLFGINPSEVKTWPDVVKFLNTDLLKKMIDYDPTAIQKKIRVKRCKKILKVLKRGDVKKRGSTPAQYMHDWQVISMELRDKAVESRKKYAELYFAANEEDEYDNAELSSDELAVDGDDDVAGSVSVELLDSKYHEEIPMVSENSKEENEFSVHIAQNVTDEHNNLKIEKLEIAANEIGEQNEITTNFVESKSVTDPMPEVIDQSLI